MPDVKGAMRVRLLEGRDVLEELGGRLDALHAATHTPVTSRRPWLQAWLDCYGGTRPFALAVEDGWGRLAAAALLTEASRANLRHVVPLGNGPSDQVRFPARDVEAAAALARGLADTLSSTRGPWRLSARHLPCDDPVVGALRATLPHAWVMPGEISPLLAVGTASETRAYVSRNHHQQVRRMRNRMRRDGLVPTVEHLTDPDAIAAVLPEVVEVCRARDHALGRRSQVDDPRAGAFLPEVVTTHARRGETVLTTLRLDGRLAAYVLCFVDGDTYRMWNCRFDPQWERYGVGRVANHSALEHALAHGCRVFDWMRGEESYKRAMANGEILTVDLYAASNALLAATCTAPPRLRQSARRLEATGATGSRAVRIVRRIVRGC